MLCRAYSKRMKKALSRANCLILNRESGRRSRTRTCDPLIKKELVQLQLGVIKLQVTLVACPRFEPPIGESLVVGIISLQIP